MKVGFSFYAHILCVAIRLHRMRYAPPTDPILKRLYYACVANDFNIGPMKTNEIKYVNGDVCARVTCTEDGYVEYVECYVSTALANCKNESRPANRNYPKCCNPFAVC